jgi:predicted Holliday junction resolvase-like endonuclease
MKENADLNKFVEDLAEKVEPVVEEAVTKSVREVEHVVVEEVMTWFQKLKSWWPTLCRRPHQNENPSLAKPEETESTRVD